MDAPQLIAQLIGMAIAAAIAFFVWRDAEENGMNKWGWSIFVFLICIIGLPTYFIVRQQVRRKETERIRERRHMQPTHAQRIYPDPMYSDTGDTKLCPYCAEDVLVEAIKCKHCGSMLNDPRPEETVPVSQPPPLFASRPRNAIEFTCSCGKKYKFKSEMAGRRGKCKQCGAKIQVPSDPGY